MKVVKRDGTSVDFDSQKIINAVNSAFKATTGSSNDKVASRIAYIIEYELSHTFNKVDISAIEKCVFEEMCKWGEIEVARAYEGYRSIQEHRRKINTIDEDVLKLVGGNNTELNKENSNKDSSIIGTMRDYIAGIVSKDIAMRLMIPAHIVEAHKSGKLWFHDMDYFITRSHNCCLVNLEDMFENNTVINDRLIETPGSFKTACTIMTQIAAQIASGQYGGQTMTIKHLAPYLRKTYEKYIKVLGKDQAHTARILTMKELRAGVKTLRYQLNTLQTSNGQTPFITLYLEVERGHEYEAEMSYIVREMLMQRMEGMKNKYGQKIYEAFPKLVYLLDENNAEPDTPYYWLTKIAAECSAKCLAPDYQSKKIMMRDMDDYFPPMGCRSQLSQWKDENGNYKWYGRFNQGVITLNLPQIGLYSRKNKELFWKLLDQRLELCKEALMVRHNALKGMTGDSSPIHWQHGGLARLEPGEPIDKLLVGGYSTISLGYVGIYELTKLVIGESHTTPKGVEFAKEVLMYMKKACDKWKEETNIGFGLYGTPGENLVSKLCEMDRKNFGIVEDVTDKGYYTNSYHVDVREKINAFDKLAFESQFHAISSGGCISYIEVPNMQNNLEAVEQIIQFIYHNVRYAEINTKADTCYECGYTGEIIVDRSTQTWICPQCTNDDPKEMQVVRRTCGYIGSTYWNEGRTKEIHDRVLHI